MSSRRRAAPKRVPIFRRKRRNGNKNPQSTLRVATRSIPFRITQTTSGTGAITSVESGLSLTASNSAAIDPYSIGGRANHFASQFLRYRIERIMIQFVSDETSSGVVESVSGATTTPSYASRVFAMGLFRDPALSTITYENLVAMGGFIGNTSRNMKARFRGSPWLFTSTTAGSPTNIDLRMTAPYKLYFEFQNNSTTAAASYGHLVFNITWLFQGAIDNAVPLGRSLPPPQTPTSNSFEVLGDDDDEKQESLTEVTTLLQRISQLESQIKRLSTTQSNSITSGLKIADKF